MADSELDLVEYLETKTYGEWDPDTVRRMARALRDETLAREPDAMCHASDPRRHLEEWGGDLVIRPYDPEKCDGAGPPWPVWIGRPRGEN